ncbi:MAG: BamA/TamA family outer membrane protein [Melioribacteraceae bacterium]|nr:BamA/TamA family outer membrane protein [Melioribacteraceae bacterium]
MIKKFQQIYFLVLIGLVSLNASVNAQKEPVELTEINFAGNDNISASVLSNIIVSKESPGWFSQFLNSFLGFGEEATYFDSSLIPSDINYLTTYYYDNGYFGIRLDYDFSIDTLDNEAVLNYYIDEGEPAYFSKIDIKGIETIHTEFKSAVIQLAEVDTSDIYNKSRIEEIQVEMLTYLRNRGLMLANTESPNVIIDTLNNKADVVLTLTPGVRYQISDVRVDKSGEGKEIVDNDLITRIVNINTGEYYNYDKIQLAQRRLYRTNLFNSALIFGVVADTSGKLVPLQISTDVGLLNEFSPEIILNNENEKFNLGLSFGYTRKNFLGDARKFSITASAASENPIEFLTNPELSYTNVDGYADIRTLIEQPFLLGAPINTRLENYITMQKRRDEYNSTIIGSRLSFNFELPQKVYFTSFTTYYNFEHTKTFYQKNYLTGLLYLFYKQSFYPDLQDLTAEQDAEVQNAVNDYYNDLPSRSTKFNNSVLGFELRANKTDDLLYPTEGYSISMAMENANLIPYLSSLVFDYQSNEPRYYKVLFTGTGFLPVTPTKSATLGMKFTIGQIHTYQGDKFSIPFNQRFTSGGSNSVRGWGSRELVSGNVNINFLALTPESLEALLIRGLELGGYFLFEGSFEGRFKFLGNIGSAVFVDYGNTLISYKDFRFENLAVAVGFGFRYYSQIVPVRLDFGFKYYDPNDKRSFLTRLKHFGDVFQIHFGIGEAF